MADHVRMHCLEVVTSGIGITAIVMQKHQVQGAILIERNFVARHQHRQELLEKPH